MLLSIHRRYITPGQMLFCMHSKLNKIKVTENATLQNYNDNGAYLKKKKIRALILQGGGALGAFQAGAFKALSEKFTREDKQSGNGERPLFDIVAGTSIGARNAAVLASHVVENKTWTGSAEKLVEFWEYLSCPTPDITKMSAAWKKEHEKNNHGACLRRGR